MLSDIFANVRTRSKSDSGSKGIVLQAHPLDMTAPGRRPSVGPMPVAKPQSLSEAAVEPLLPSLPIESKEPAKRPCLDNLFDEIIEAEPRFAEHIENL